MNYKQFRELVPLQPLSQYSIIGYICVLLSPFLSIPCIRYHWTPNRMTLAMIITGVLAGVFFMLPWLSCKIISIILYFLWFVWDCADGEVARYTSTFSKYGRHLDWMSHLSCHSLFIIAVWASFQQLPLFYHGYVLSVVSFGLLAAELISRSINTMMSLSMQDDVQSVWKPKSIFSLDYIKTQLLYFPNLVCFYPIILVADWILQYHFAFYVWCVWAVIYILGIIKTYIRFINVMYKN